jgi:hypothetical protein
MVILREMLEPVRMPGGAPQLHVVVDTEEEFDWSAPFSRSNVSVSAIAEVERLQDVLRPYGVRPTYVIDYPVATTASSSATLRHVLERGECEIGAHLHPWVNPPYEEEVTVRNSYACNLGGELEREKISRLAAVIEQQLGVRPRVYKAGRYGFGASTALALEELGFDVDASVNPHMDYSADGGPSFEGLTAAPATFGRTRRLLEVPCTTAFTGVARAFGPRLHRAASAAWCRPLRAVGILSRTRLLNKIMLSPEGSTLQEMRWLTDTLMADGVRTFSLTFHSPSLRPGCTHYVSTTAERDAFLRTIEDYCSFFMNEVGGVPSTPATLFDQLRRGDSQ